MGFLTPGFLGGLRRCGGGAILRDVPWISRRRLPMMWSCTSSLKASRPS